MASGDMHTLFAGRTGSLDVFRLAFRRSAGSYQVRVQIRDDAGAYTSGTWYTIGDTPHAIEIEWKAATAAGAKNGSPDLWLDGVLKQTKVGIDNDTLRVGDIRLGPLAGIDAGTRGTLYFDAFESRRTTYKFPTSTPNQDSDWRTLSLLSLTRMVPAGVLRVGSCDVGRRPGDDAPPYLSR